MSVDSCEFFKDFVRRVPCLFDFNFHIVNVIFVDATCRVYPASNLIEVAACTAEQGNQITKFGQLQSDHISVNRHFAQISRHIHYARLRHTLINLFVDRFRKEQELAVEKKPSVLKKLKEAKADMPKKSTSKAKEAEL